MKRLYVSAVRAVARLFELLGVMGLLDRWAARSRTGLWVRSWFAIYDLEQMVALGVPWWTFEAIDQVERHLSSRESAQVFEWGSGASTVWLAARAGSVLTVEHDAEWASGMRSRLPDHVRLLVVPPVGSTRPAVPSAKPGHEGLDFSDYVAAIDRSPDRYDLVVIDGRAREACLARALDHLAPGGLIVFDNVDRERYRDAIAAEGARLEVAWTRGRTPSLPYPTRTALIAAGEQPR